MGVIALIFIAIVFAIQITAKKARWDFPKSGLFGFLILLAAIILVFGFAFYFSWQQYQFWKNDEMGKLLLPPYQSIDYFVFYVRTRFFNPYLLSLFFSVLALIAAKILNKKYDFRFFETIEPYLFATSIFIVGHPAWLFYSALLIIIYLTIHMVALARNYADQNADQRGKNISANLRVYPRVSAYYVWLPTAILIILISRWIVLLPWWQILKF